MYKTPFYWQHIKPRTTKNIAIVLSKATHKKYAPHSKIQIKLRTFELQNPWDNWLPKLFVFYKSFPSFAIPRYDMCIILTPRRLLNPRTRI